MENYKISDNAEIEVTEEGSKMIMTWKGSVDSDNANNILGNYLFEFHAKCKNQGIAELRINMYAVDFMNSSGIKNMISWMRDVSEENSYKTKVEYDRSISWQDVTFATFSPLITNIQFVAKQE